MGGGRSCAAAGEGRWYCCTVTRVRAEVDAGSMAGGSDVGPQAWSAGAVQLQASRVTAMVLDASAYAN